MHMLTHVGFAKLNNHHWSQCLKNEGSIGKIYPKWQIHSELLNIPLLLKIFLRFIYPHHCYVCKQLILLTLYLVWVGFFPNFFLTCEKMRKTKCFNRLLICLDLHSSYAHLVHLALQQWGDSSGWWRVLSCAGSSTGSCSHQVPILGKANPNKTFLVREQRPNTVRSATGAEPIQAHKGQQHFIRSYWRCCSLAEGTGGIPWAQVTLAQLWGSQSTEGRGSQGPGHILVPMPAQATSAGHGTEHQIWIPNQPLRLLALLFTASVASVTKC